MLIIVVLHLASLPPFNHAGTHRGLPFAQAASSMAALEGCLGTTLMAKLADRCWPGPKGNSRSVLVRCTAADLERVQSPEHVSVVCVCKQLRVGVLLQIWSASLCIWVWCVSKNEKQLLT